jgi:uncharacterized protein YeaO (DUF488 family)
MRTQYRSLGRRRRANRSPVCFAEEHEVQAAARDPDVRIRRIYDPRGRADGFRVLVDRLWPRGMTKERAALDVWARDLAPSAELRTWFHHDPKLWAEFRKRYRSELRDREADLVALRARSTRRRVTLLYAARDPRFNHAAVLRDAIIDAR